MLQKVLVPNKRCKQEHVESNVSNTWKLDILNIIESRISFQGNNLDHVPPIPKLNVSDLKKWLQELLKKSVVGPADKGTNNDC